MHLENSSVTPYTLEEIIWSTPLTRPLSHCPNPFLFATLIVWDCHRKFLVPPPSPVNPFHLPSTTLVPSASSIGFFSQWQSAGLTRLIDITQNGRLQDKLALEQQTLTSLPWYQYLQLSHVITDLNKNKQLHHSLTDFAKLLSSGMIGRQGLISSFYHLLLYPIRVNLPAWCSG